MLRRAVWDELRQLDSIIQNATVQYEGESFTYHEACARWEGECFTNDILNLDFIIDDVSIRLEGEAEEVKVFFKQIQFLIFAG